MLFCLLLADIVTNILIICQMLSGQNKLSFLLSKYLIFFQKRIKIIYLLYMK